MPARRAWYPDRAEHCVMFGDNLTKNRTVHFVSIEILNYLRASSLVPKKIIEAIDVAI